MKAGKRCARRSGCPLNATLETFGDAWSLLIVRDLMFSGRTSFREFLESGEGIATNILTDRLQRLEANGIIVKERDPEDARKIVYALTETGISLAPVLVEMILWGAEHFETDAPPATIRAMKKDRAKFLAALRESAATSSSSATTTRRGTSSRARASRDR